MKFFALGGVLIAAQCAVLAAPPHANGHEHRPLRTQLALTAAPASKSTGAWQPLKHQPGFLNCSGAVDNPILLTDGSVLMHEYSCSTWWKLTPDEWGNYVNGTWSAIASYSSDYAPIFFSSAVLPDGRVITEGGEYNQGQDAWTTLGAIYDPIANVWTPVAPPDGWQSIGDAQSVVLANGVYMQANCCTKDAALLDPKTLTWTPTGTGKYDVNDEEGWTLLPTGDVLAVDAYVFLTDPTGKRSELYSPKTGSWTFAGNTPVQLWDSGNPCNLANASDELGPAVLRPDGTVFYTGSNSCGAGHTAIFDSKTSKWTKGPDFPKDLDIADGPAALEPNGKVLMMASPGIFNNGSVFLEWDGSKLSPANGTIPNAPGEPSYVGNMLVLPTGQILLTDESADVEIYTPAGKPEDAWRPAITKLQNQLQRGQTYTLSGTLLNGVSQGAAYGDDAQAATNYPLIRATSTLTGHVTYLRTHDHSSMAVASNAVSSTHFDIPPSLNPGIYLIEVVANGIASYPVVVHIQ